MFKSELRTLYSSKRKALTEAQMQDYNSGIYSLLVQILNEPGFKCIHIYLSSKANNEPETDKIINYLLDSDKSVLVPSMEPGYAMNHFLYHRSLPLIINKFGIPEPEKANSQLSDLVPDVVVVPLLAFDYKGYRVGYGKGYYDRYLSTLPSNVLKVGLSFYLPVEEIYDVNEFDIAMDFCVTPHKIFEFNLY